MDYRELQNTPKSLRDSGYTSQSFKMNKGQIKLLDKAILNPHKVVSVTICIRSARSVKHIEGIRELNAAQALIKQNYFQEISRTKNKDNVGTYITYTFRLLCPQPAPAPQQL